jgi:Protein of unknown function (DUF2585)
VTAAALSPRDRIGVAAGIVAILAIGAAALLAMCHPLICKCGYVKLWHGEISSSENSQHISDWYTPSHLIHGLLFYALLWLVARRWPVGFRALVALAVEVGWEIVENTPWIINRYRGTTISLDYFGDSVINSASDAIAMLIGFWLASKLPVWASVAVIVAAELIVGWFIRDNLTLNVIMLVWPVDAIRVWQGGA